MGQLTEKPSDNSFLISKIILETRRSQAALWETGWLLKTGDRHGGLHFPWFLGSGILGKSMSPRDPATKSTQSTFQGLMGLEAVDWKEVGSVGCLEELGF